MGFKTGTSQVDGSINIDGSIYQWGSLFMGSTDGSFAAVWTKFGYVDTSLNNLGVKNAAQDVSLNAVWTKLGSVDTSLNNLGIKDAAQDASIVALRTKDANQDTSLNAVWTKFGSVDTSLNNLGIKDATQDASIVALRTKDTNIDTSLNNLGIKDAVQDASIVALRTKDTNIDTSLNGIWTKFGSVDTSLNNLGVKNANQDVSLNAVWTKLGSVDTSLNNLGVKDAAQDTSISIIRAIYIPNASLNTATFKWVGGYLEPSVASTAPDVTKAYVDGSLAVVWTKLGHVDTSLNALGVKNAAQDTSLNAVWTKIGSIDTSLNNLGIKDVTQDASIVALRTKDTNIDTSLNNLGIKDATQDASIVALRTKDTNQDTSLNAVWTKLGSVDTSLNNLGVKNAAQDTSLNAVWTKLGSVDTSLNNLGIKDAAQDTSISIIRATYIPNASLNQSTFKWVTGLLEPSVAGSAIADVSIVASGRNLAETDNNKILHCTNALTMTVPAGLSTGFQCTIVNKSTGSITIAESSTTIESADSDKIITKQHTGVTIYHAGSNVYTMVGAIGDVAAGGGDVAKSGSPANTYLARWTDPSTITGDASLRYSNGILTVSETDISISGSIKMKDGGSLWIGSATDASARVRVHHAVATGHAYIDYYENLYLRSGWDGTDRTIVCTSLGRIGVGTTAPALQQHIVSSAPSALPATTGAAQLGGILRLNNSDTNAILDFGGYGADGYWMQATHQTALNSTYPILINPNGGRVGVCTSTFITRESSSGTAFTVNVAVNTVPASSTYGLGVFGVPRLVFGGTNTAGNRINTAEIYVDNVSLTEGAEAGVMHLRTKPSNNSQITAITINSSQNVGFGTTTPNAKLDIVTGNAVGINWKFSTSFGNSNISNVFDSGANATNKMNFNVNNAAGVATTRVTILGDGKVGIGTTSPSNIFVVKDTQEIDLYTSGGNVIMEAINRDNTSAAVNIQMYARNGDLVFNTGQYTERMRILNSGNVGIGTVAPSAKLHVDGSILATNYITVNDYTQVLNTSGAEGFKMQWNNTEKSIDFIIN